MTAARGVENGPEYYPEAIDVHFVIHSHLDAGWLRTYDEYYYEAGKFIFDSVIE